MLRTETIERDTLELLMALMQDEQLNYFNLVGGSEFLQFPIIS